MEAARQVVIEVESQIDPDARSDIRLATGRIEPRQLKRALWDIIAIAGQAIRSHEDDGVAVATRIKDRAEEVMDNLLEPASARWTYCTDRLPPEDQEVPIALSSGIVTVAAWWADGWSHDTLDWTQQEVYAWRPLPEPPPVREEG